MIAVIFEFRTPPERAGEYFDLAGALRPQLDRIDGFLSIERFESVTTPGKFVSLSFWRDEHAVAQWRNLEQHRSAQARGRSGLFSDYRLRVASVLRDYGLHDRDQVPEDSRRRHGSEKAG